MGFSICESLHLGDLVATSADEYVMKAVALANDLPRLSHLRAGLRQRLIDSGMLDRARFIRELESVYEDLKRRL
jgi:predicted O-linked N-acetylglucosamine transferase (SPINDLY family)